MSREPKYVTYRQALAGLVVALPMLGGFGWAVFTISAEAADRKSETTATVLSVVLTRVNEIAQEVSEINKFLREKQ